MKLAGALLLGAMVASGPVLSEPLKIGFVATLSGPGAAVGVDMVDGFKLGLKNATRAANVELPEVIYEDDQLKPDVGRQVVGKLLERDRVDLVTGMP